MMSEPAKSSRTKIFRTGIGQAGLLISVVLLGAGLASILLVPVEGSSWLQNVGNLGQFISGIFAPVAFVWVVIAVVLQGRELELQREELQETREVLTLQKEEMKRAADENREQTRIMTENLKSDAERKLYEEVDTRLYSLALYICGNYGDSYVSFGEGGRYLIYLNANVAAGIDRNNFDRIYVLLFLEIMNFFNYMQNNAVTKISDSSFIFFEYLHNELSRIGRTKRHLENDQVLARLGGLQIQTTLDLLDEIENKGFIR